MVDGESGAFCKLLGTLDSWLTEQYLPLNLREGHERLWGRRRGRGRREEGRREEGRREEGRREEGKGEERGEEGKREGREG